VFAYLKQIERNRGPLSVAIIKPVRDIKFQVHNTHRFSFKQTDMLGMSVKRKAFLPTRVS